MAETNYNDKKELSPRGAMIFGIVFILAGLMIILVGLGILPTDQSKVHAPGWIIACAGLVFVLSGAAVINGYALSKNTALYSSAIQYFLGMGIVGLMLIICGWVAFGPGERHFTVSSTFSTAAPTSERSGRIVFGIGFLMIFALFANGIISSIKKKIK